MRVIKQKEKGMKIKMDKKEKNRRDFGRLAIKIIAGILALMMVLAVAGTLIYYLV